MTTGDYNHGLRPSEHTISEGWFTHDNGGSIHGSTLSFDDEVEPANSVIRMANTKRDSRYYDWCKKNSIAMHPARMPLALAKFFISFLTDPGDLVLDPFGGSGTTGQAADEMKRKWVLVEPNGEYLDGAKGRFDLK